jgi:predicted Rossmann fold flavoprotein
MLFTHRGLSGPAILQLSSYWREGEGLTLDLSPGQPAEEALRAARGSTPKTQVTTALARLMPDRLATVVAGLAGLTGPVGPLSNAALAGLARLVHALPILPVGSEGYRTAEVMLGGVDTDALDARTMEAKAVPGLYFIGEVVDVTGWLGGYNFQWAWSSGWAAGQAV